MKYKISDVKEKEIDFIVAEEFASSPSFLSLFIDNFEEYHGDLFKISQIIRSHTDSYGESDLEISLNNKDGFCLALLIENKISAQFQDDQLFRYQLRGESYLKQKKCNDFKIILIAPKAYGYGDENDEIDARIDYEDLIEWFKNETSKNSRYHFKKYLLEKALEKATLGYQPIEDDKVTQFWEDYWKLVNKVAPILNMPKPRKKPSGSTFINFNPSDLLSGYRLVNKVTFGVIDLQIAGLAKNIGDFRAEFNEVFDHPYEIAKAGKSVSIRIQVPELDLQVSVSKQEDKIRHILEEVLNLYQWYQSNNDPLHRIVDKWT